MDILLSFSTLELFLISLLFVWTGFVRSGLGFGGAALGLPLLLFIYNQPLFWLPVIAIHLLFFSSLTLSTHLHQIDKKYLKKSLLIIIPFTLIGVAGLVTFPTKWLLIFIYSITLFYSLLWAFGLTLISRSQWLDRGLLAIGGYVAGTSLTGAPLIVAVFMKNVSSHLLRNTLFVLWFMIVAIKMTAFITLGIELNAVTALVLLPIASIGHLIGLKTHQYILKNDALFKRLIGSFLALISTLGLFKVWLNWI